MRDLGGRRRLLELQVLDLVAARSDPLRRCEDLLDVVVGLAEMPLQVEHALAQPAHVLHQPAHLALDEMRLLAHLHVFQDRLHGLHREHQHVRRADDDAGAMRLLHEVGEMLGEIGIDRLRRHEQDRGVLRLAGDEIALGHGVDMAADIDAHAPRRVFLLLVASRGAERLEAFERKLGVDHHARAVFGICSRQSGRLPFESVAWNV